MAAPRPEHAHVSTRPAAATPTPRPPHPRQQDGRKTNVLSSANDPSTVALQQRCHRTSASAPSPSWPHMPRPRLQRAATARQEKIQLPIAEQNFSSVSPVAYSFNGELRRCVMFMYHNICLASSIHGHHIMFISHSKSHVIHACTALFDRRQSTYFQRPAHPAIVRAHHRMRRDP